MPSPLPPSGGEKTLIGWVGPSGGFAGSVVCFGAGVSSPVLLLALTSGYPLIGSKVWFLSGAASRPPWWLPALWGWCLGRVPVLALGFAFRFVSLRCCLASKLLFQVAQF